MIALPFFDLRSTNKIDYIIILTPKGEELLQDIQLELKKDIVLMMEIIVKE
jgi:hypothetical protein